MNIQDMIDETKAEIISAQNFIDTYPVQDNRFIVGRVGLWLSDVVIVDGKTTGNYSITSNPVNAMTFSRDTAKSLASVTKNGNGWFLVTSKISSVTNFLMSRNDHLKVLEAYQAKTAV